MEVNRDHPTLCTECSIPVLLPAAGQGGDETSALENSGHNMSHGEMDGTAAFQAFTGDAGTVKKMTEGNLGKVRARAL